MADNADHSDPFLQPPWLSIAADHPLADDAPATDGFDLGRQVGPIYDILRHPQTKTPMAAGGYRRGA